MTCKRTSAITLLVVTLLFCSMLTAHLPTACARHVVVPKANDGLNIRTHIGEAMGRRDGKKGWEGRKLIGAGDIKNTEAAGRADPVTNAGSGPRTVEMRAARKHRDAVSKMYDMFRRDYINRASRRPPVHNDEPLEEEP